MSEKTPQALIDLLVDESVRYLTSNDSKPTLKDYLRYMTHIYWIVWNASHNTGFLMYLGYLSKRDPYDRIFCCVAGRTYDHLFPKKCTQVLDVDAAQCVRSAIRYHWSDEYIIAHEARFYLTLPGTLCYDRLKLSAAPSNDASLRVLFYAYYSVRDTFGLQPIDEWINEDNWIMNEFREIAQA